MLCRCISIYLVLTVVLAAAVSAQASVTFSLDPVSGNISGNRGDTIGWGFTVSNDTPYWLSVSGSGFVMDKDLSWGTYVDFSTNSVPVAPVFYLNPTLLTMPFNLIDVTGAGSFAISPDTPFGDRATGQITFSYDIYYSDPSKGGAQLLPGGDGHGSFSINATVATTVVPEPSTYLLLAIALVAVGVVRRKMSNREV